MIINNLKDYIIDEKDLGDCIFYKLEVNEYRINIQEDKTDEYHFFSIRKGDDEIFSGYSENFDNIIHDIGVIIND